MQYQITHADLSLVLALERGRSLAKAAELLKVDVSTVFRSIRRLESALGTALFVKSRKGYLPTDTAQALAEQAERAEQALEAARIAMTSGEQVVSGTVRLTLSLIHIYVDALREVSREGDQYSWWPDNEQAEMLNLGYRFDYQILTPGLRRFVRNARLPRQPRFSQHAPLIVDYDWTLTI